MKRILFLVLVAGSFASCKKDKHDTPSTTVITPGTLVKDGSVADQMAESPVTNLRVATYKYAGGTNDTMLYVSLHVGTTIPVSQMNSVRVVIKRTPTDSIVLTGTNVLQEGTWQTAVLFRKNEIATITVDLSFPVQLVNKEFTPRLALRSLTATPAYVLGQKTTFAVTKVTTNVHAGTPEGNKVSGNQQVETLIVDVTAVGGVATLATFFVKVQDPTVVQSVEILDNGTPIGTGSFTGNTAGVPVISVVPANTPKTYSVRLNLKPVLLNQSGTNVKTSVWVQYQTASGAIRTNDTLRTGNDFFVYKAVPKITREVVNRILTNRTRMTVVSFFVTAPSQGDIAIRQFGGPLSLKDLSVDSVLQLTQPIFTIDNVNMNAAARIMKENGDTVSVFPETATHFYVAANNAPGEYVVLAGTTRKFSFSLVPEGFNTAEFDAFIADIGADGSTMFEYLNLGTIGQHIKMYTSGGQDAAAIPFDIVWHDRNVTNYNTSPIFSSKGWNNGNKVIASQPPQVFSREL